MGDEVEARLRGQILKIAEDAGVSPDLVLFGKLEKVDFGTEWSLTAEGVTPDGDRWRMVKTEPILKS